MNLHTITYRIGAGTVTTVFCTRQAARRFHRALTRHGARHILRQTFTPEGLDVLAQQSRRRFGAGWLTRFPGCGPTGMVTKETTI